MKTNNLKLTIGLFLASLGYAQAQNGLENVVVEKYYVANAADAARHANESGITFSSLEINDIKTCTSHK